LRSLPHKWRTSGNISQGFSCFQKDDLVWSTRRRVGLDHHVIASQYQTACTDVDWSNHFELPAIADFNVGVLRIYVDSGDPSTKLERAVDNNREFRFIRENSRFGGHKFHIQIQSFSISLPLC
jgi:hypothetical protein